MARSSGSARTAPKGRATPGRHSTVGGGSLLTPTVQWILVTLVGLLIIAAIVYFGSDLGDGGGGGNHTGLAPATVVEHAATAA